MMEKSDRIYCRKHSYAKGEQFGRLTLTGVSYLKSMYGQQRRIVEADCDCGVMRAYVFSSLIGGETKSCGCLQKELSKARFTTHGLSSHPLYDVRQAMLKRCYVPHDAQFKDYGGRGIEVCEQWQESFEIFYEWAVENGYQSGLTLDRIDNDKNYCPENCTWNTRGGQSRNNRRNRNFTAFGETKCLFDWGKDPRCVLSVWGLRNRMDRGKWTGSFEEALTTPLEDRKKVQRNNKRAKMYTAWGETKCMAAWLEDKRCLVKIDSFRDRIAKGWSAKDAMSKPPTRDGKNKK